MTGRWKSSKKDISDLSVLACGFFLEQYPRYDTLWEALSRSGLQQLIDLRDKVAFGSNQMETLPAEQDRNIFHRTIGKISSLYRVFKYAVNIMRTVRQKKVDIIFVFPANFFLTICLGMLKFLHGARVYFDLFTSAYSATRTHAPNKLKIAEAYVMEFLCSRLADQLICLTPEYAIYYQNLYKARPDKLSVVRDAVQDIWFEQPADTSQDVQRFKRVLYWGNYLIHHGLDMILDSAEELKNENIEFVFCGKGNGEAQLREDARRRNLSNVVFKGFVPTTEELIHVVDSAYITLGQFRDMHDIRLSAANKQMQGMARGKPVITVWTKQQEDLYQTKNNPVPPVIQIKSETRALSEAIRDLVNNPQKAKQIGDIARSTVKRLHSVEAIAPALKEALEKH